MVENADLFSLISEHLFNGACGVRGACVARAVCKEWHERVMGDPRPRVMPTPARWATPELAADVVALCASEPAAAASTSISSDVGAIRQLAVRRRVGSAAPSAPSDWDCQHCANRIVDGLHARI